MLQIALGFLLGIVVFFKLSLIGAVVSLLLFTLALLSLYKKKYLWVFASFCGILWAGLWSYQLSEQQFPQSKSRELVHVYGQVDGLVRTRITDETDGSNLLSQRFFFDVSSQSSLALGRVRLSTFDSEINVHSGDECDFEVRLKPPHGLANPGGFNFDLWAQSEHLTATGYVVSGQCKKASGFNLHRLRDTVSQLLIHHLGDNQPSALLRALSVGDRRGLSAKSWDVLSRTGLSHLVAISGLHIGLMALFGFWLGREIDRFFSHSKGLFLPILCALTLASGYAAMAGFSVPTQRALWMLGGASLTALFRQHRNGFDYLGAALLAVLIFDPFSVLSAGFWMSFTATSVLIMAFSGENMPLEGEGKTLQVFRSQWAVYVALILPGLWLFGRASLVSPFINLLAIPLVSFLLVPVLFCGLILLAVMPALAQPFLELAHGLARVLLEHAGDLSSVPVLNLQGEIPVWVYLTAISGAFILITPLKKWLLLPSLVLMLTPFLWKETLHDGEFDVQVLDVGQGLAVVVKTVNHVLLFDTGMKFRTGSDMGQSVILPYFQYMGIDELDMLVVSHGDSDHSGGAKSILATIPVNTFMSSAVDKFDVADRCINGQTWHWDGVDFEFLNPTEGMPYLGNDSSCTLRVSSQFGSALLPGDISDAVEYRLSRLPDDRVQSDLLIAPHHGSKTSSTLEFLEKIQPNHAVYSAGFLNRFNMPHEIVKKRYDGLGIKTWNTAVEGAVRIKFHSEGVEVVSERNN